MSKLTLLNLLGIGVIFSKKFTIRTHILAVCSSCFCHLRDLQHNRRQFDLDSAKLLATALARLVTKSPPFTRSLPLLCFLQWLPVRFRILFKINLLTCKTLCEKHPVYLHSMLAASLPSRSLRSNNDNSRSVHRVKTSTGVRAIHSRALSLWNNLPLSVHSANSVATFKKHLKTHPFDLAFLP